MSMNISIFAKRNAIAVKRNGEQVGFIDSRCFSECWQTPTDVTNDIMSSSNCIDSYKKWVMTYDKETCYVEDLYADNDPFCEGTVIGKITKHPAIEHCDRLNLWLQQCDDEGFTVDCCVV